MKKVTVQTEKDFDVVMIIKLEAVLIMRRYSDNDLQDCADNMVLL
jgi:hypothetical protein